MIKNIFLKRENGGKGKSYKKVQSAIFRTIAIIARHNFYDFLVAVVAVEA